MINTDCPLNTFNPIVFAGDEKCKQKCDSTSGCVAFVLVEVKEGLHTRFACQLKTKCTNRTTDDGKTVYLQGTSKHSHCVNNINKIQPCTLYYDA